MFSSGTKRLLKNYILHTGTHNRIVEENDMWKQHGMMRPSSNTNRTWQNEPKKESFLDDSRDDMNDSQYNMKRCSAHMDERKESSGSSTYWARQLQKTEESDPDRWGHSGFKELYPKDFRSDHSEEDSSSSSSSSSSDDRRKRKKKKKKKQLDKEKEKKRKKSKHKKKELSYDTLESFNKKKRKSEKKNSKRKADDANLDTVEDNVSRKRVKKSKPKHKEQSLDRRRKKKSKHKHSRKDSE